MSGQSGASRSSRGSEDRPDDGIEHGGEFGARLERQLGRLRLLLGHLAGPALRRRTELDDLVQEVCLRAIRDRGRAPAAEAGDAAFGRWIAELARHVVIDGIRFWRAAKRGERVERLGRSDWSTLGPDESALLAATAGPATRVGADEESARLERAFAALAPEHRRVIALRQLEGLPAAEVARRMGRSETAVHSLYRRALLAWQEDSGLR